eukprot:CAMPEP_0174369610 /NCGR_PEP_ID=MMETSP0811_2-20130205/93095_1 /TAXON_ID=73025 ORGANISM="Eutreptiella gymnastica-like, Strain CCMP1594" /NCGR_SAMPLE_ID=MMETSP0811_2 /ASSEMBLY_ACC=CAM_ASM_000667 /LENGTH=93 /DNA_ID=CAMNT_0015514223 /DNA_START=26 /DNA_END=307 /DNA_ORIENTATION=+
MAATSCHDVPMSPSIEEESTAYCSSAIMLAWYLRCTASSRQSAENWANTTVNASTAHWCTAVPMCLRWLIALDQGATNWTNNGRMVGSSQPRV